jgi:hypothetical protein
MEFKSGFDKLKCFRVMNEEGIIDPSMKIYEDAID